MERIWPAAVGRLAAEDSLLARSLAADIMVEVDICYRFPRFPVFFITAGSGAGSGVAQGGDEG